MRYHAQADFTVAGARVTVHALHCGTVTVKRCHASCCLPERTPSLLRFLAILADRRFAEPMPIWCYAVEHPDGVFVVDAGASPSYNDARTWRQDPRTAAVIRSFIKLDVRTGQTLPERLADAGLAPSAVRAVVLTHQHIDHTGTVPDFQTDIWTTPRRMPPPTGSAPCTGAGGTARRGSDTSTSRDQQANSDPPWLSPTTAP